LHSDSIRNGGALCVTFTTARQQRLVHTVITLKLAQRALERGAGDALSLVSEALEHAERATQELRELAHGILPAALTAGGLRGGVGALASRMPMPVEMDICAERLSATVEATAYFVVAEALTNVAKHARAASAGFGALMQSSRPTPRHACSVPHAARYAAPGLRIAR